MNRPGVSVVLPTRDRCRVLPRAIASVLEQSLAPLELIVVDDASGDATEEVVRGFDDPRVRLLHMAEHGGANRARNLGIEAARGDFVAFQDSDDQWLPRKLELQMAALAEAPESSAVYCKLRRVSPDGTAPERVFGRSFDQRALLCRNFIGTPTLVVRRELVRDCPFDVELERRQDWELCLRLMQRCRFAFADQVLVIAHTTPGSVSDDPQRLLRAYQHIFNRHEDLIRSSARALAEFEAAIGVLEARVGEWSEARRHLLRAPFVWPFRLEHWLRAVAAASGEAVYRRLAQRGVHP